jgi:hypothetical protein
MIDIADKGVLIDYLWGRGIFKKGSELYVRYFSGGVSCNVAFVSGGGKEILVKQALPKLKVAELWECDPQRIVIEYRALEVYAGIVPRCVPAPLFYDQENLVLCREAVPEKCPMWKTRLLEGQLDFRIAGKAIAALLEVHNQTAHDKNIADIFRDTGVFYNLRVNPYIEFTVSRHPELKEKASQVITLLMNSKIALIHGDYSPKNILIMDDRLFILDMEVAHFGSPAFDLAFFSNHFLLKAVKNKAWKEAYLNMLKFMTGIYFSNVTCMDAAELEKITIQVLGFLFLARVDGKSPVEYITEDPDKDLVRSMAFKIIREDPSTFREVIQMVLRDLNGMDQIKTIDV